MAKAAPLILVLSLVISLLIQYPPANASFAAEWEREGAILGRQARYRIKADESFPEIAREYSLGYNAITAANPGVDPFVPERRRLIVMPTEWIIPDVSMRRGIVINLAEMRLYLFLKDHARKVTTFPVGIGDEGKDTPVGLFSIIEKIRNPAWHVPESIRREKPHLPAVVPPGPGNPLGNHALRLSRRTILLHGTNRPWGIGMRSSSGCIRLYRKDIARLFLLTPLGMPVTIVNQGVKAAVKAGGVYLEVHDYSDGRNLYREALRVLKEKKLLSRVDLAKVRKAAKERTGLLVKVSS